MSKRSKTDPNARLSEQMEEVLLWVYTFKPSEVTPPSSHDLTRYVAEKLVPWRPSDFAGENLTPSKRITLSNTLKRLEERGLLVRYSIGYKDGVVARLAIIGNLNDRLRTTHVGMTGAGARVVLGMTDDSFDREEWETNAARRKLKSRVEGLRFAFKLVHLEHMKQKAERVESARKSFESINASLGQMTKTELDEKTRLAWSAVRDTLHEFEEELKGE